MWLRLPACDFWGHRLEALSLPTFFRRDSVISRSGTRKSSDANVLAVTPGFDFAQRSAGFSEVFRLPLRKMWVMTRARSLCHLILTRLAGCGDYAIAVC